MSSNTSLLAKPDDAPSSSLLSLINTGTTTTTTTDNHKNKLPQDDLLDKTSSSSLSLPTNNTSSSTDSLFRMTTLDHHYHYHFDDLPPPVMTTTITTTTPAAFHPVDDYQDFSLRELLDLTDDFTWEHGCGSNNTSSHEQQQQQYGNDLLSPTPLNLPDCHTTVSSALHHHTPSLLVGTAATHHCGSSVFSIRAPSVTPLTAAVPVASALLNHQNNQNNQNNSTTTHSCTPVAAPAAPISGPERPVTNPKKRRRRDSLAALENGGTTDTNKKPKNQDAARFRPYQAGQWNERFQDLLQFRQKHGHCLVPHTYTDNLPLARWVKRQRYQYKLWQDGSDKTSSSTTSSTLTDERRKALEEIGFCWDSQGAAWDDRLAELVAFAQTHRHCNVPSHYAANPQLATWVKCQRRQYKLYQQGQPSNMTPARIQELSKIGFEWLLRSYSKKTKNTKDAVAAVKADDDDSS